MLITTKFADVEGVHLMADAAEFIFRRLCPGALLVTIHGNDEGQFGTSCLDEIRLEILRHGPLALLIDATRASNVSVAVSKEWTRFFAEARSDLSTVSVLTGSKLINLTVAIAQHLSHTGNLIQIYTDRDLFERAVSQAHTRALLRWTQTNCDHGRAAP